MSRIITSPVQEFPGTVTISEPVLYPQYLQYRRLMVESDQAHTDGRFVDQEIAAWGALVACIETFDVPGFESNDPTQFPASPRRAVIDLLQFIVGEVRKVIVGEEHIPNA